MHSRTQAVVARAMIGAGDAPLFVSILALCGEKFPDARSTLFGFTLLLCKIVRACIYIYI